MHTAGLKYGIPDVDLPRLGGGTVNPSNFAGHDFAVLFCPASPTDAAKELTAYHARADKFCSDEAWIVAIAGQAGSEDGAPLRNSPIAVGLDRDGAAWRAFEALLRPNERPRREEGAVFLFRRGGNLQRTWTGSGHAEDVATELGKRF